MQLEEAEHAIGSGAAYVDLRRVRDYLELHIPGSLSLQYEFGPGMQQRARDCIPLAVPFVVLDDGVNDMADVAGALRGKGFAVVGVLEDGLNAWTRAHGAPASSEVIPAQTRPPGTLLSVGDPGSPRLDDALFIPGGKLWERVDEVPRDEAVTVIAGRGVRAALAVGVLERAGFNKVGFWETRPSVR